MRKLVHFAVIVVVAASAMPAAADFVLLKGQVNRPTRDAIKKLARPSGAAPRPRVVRPPAPATDTSGFSPNDLIYALAQVKGLQMKIDEQPDMTFKDRTVDRIIEVTKEDKSGFEIFISGCDAKADHCREIAFIGEYIGRKTTCAQFAGIANLQGALHFDCDQEGDRAIMYMDSEDPYAPYRKTMIDISDQTQFRGRFLDYYEHWNAVLGQIAWYQACERAVKKKQTCKFGWMAS